VNRIKNYSRGFTVQLGGGFWAATCPPLYICSIPGRRVEGSRVAGTLRGTPCCRWGRGRRGRRRRWRRPPCSPSGPATSRYTPYIPRTQGTGSECCASGGRYSNIENTGVRR